MGSKSAGGPHWLASIRLIGARAVVLRLCLVCSNVALKLSLHVVLEISHRAQECTPRCDRASLRHATAIRSAIRPRASVASAAPRHRIRHYRPDHHSCHCQVESRFAHKALGRCSRHWPPLEIGPQMDSTSAAATGTLTLVTTDRPSISNRPMHTFTHY